MNNWYTSTKPQDKQGLVIEEKTGKNIAVSYIAGDARLIAAAPELLAALGYCIGFIAGEDSTTDADKAEVLDLARAAIEKATN